MLCPVCSAQMLTLESERIKVDYCRECSGAWLDSGEAQDDALRRFLAQLDQKRRKERPLTGEIRGSE